MTNLPQSFQIEKARPPTRHLWRAHDLAVVSIEYIEHMSGDFVLSASSDRTARLWTADGKFIGTFGQVRMPQSTVEFAVAHT